MSGTEISDETLIQRVLEPETPEAEALLRACERDPTLAARALEISSLRFLLRSLAAGSAHPGPDAKQLARYASNPESLAPAERASVRVHAMLSAETRSELDALQCYTSSRALGLAAAPGLLRPLRALLASLHPGLRYAAVAAAALVAGVLIGRQMMPTAPVLIAAKSIGAVRGDAPRLDPCADPAPPRWRELAGGEIAICAARMQAAAKGEASGDLVATAPGSALAPGTRLQITEPESGREVVVVVTGESEGRVSLSPAAWARLGLDEASLAGAPLLVRIAHEDGGRD